MRQGERKRQKSRRQTSHPVGCIFNLSVHKSIDRVTPRVWSQRTLHQQQQPLAATLSCERERGGGGGGGEREGETQTDRETQTETQTDRETQTERHRQRETQTERHRQRETQTERHRQRDTDRERHRQRGRQQGQTKEENRDRQAKGCVKCNRLLSVIVVCVLPLFVGWFMTTKARCLPPTSVHKPLL